MTDTQTTQSIVVEETLQSMEVPRSAHAEQASSSTTNASLEQPQPAESKAWDQENTDGPATQQLRPFATPWQPTILRIAPLSGLAALLLAVLLLLASYAILATSDGDEVSNWQFEPNVYLAVFTAISNKAVAFAVVQGTVVTFWLRVLRGTTVAQLHRDWSYGLFVYRAIAAGRNFSFLALACICATFVAVDGPLLQRASTVRTSIPDRNVTLTARLFPELPSYQSGMSLLNATRQSMSADNNLQPVISDWNSGRLVRAIYGCPGSCSTRMMGPALAVDHCQSTRRYVYFSQPLTPKQNATWNFGAGEGPDDKIVFMTALYDESGIYESLLFKTLIAEYPGNNSCAAYVNETICYIVSAIAEYPVLVENDTVRFTEPQPYPTIVALANNTALTNDTISKFGLDYGGYFQTTLAGIAEVGLLKYRATEYLIPDRDGFVFSNPNNAPWNLFLWQHTLVDGARNHCIPEFSDPRDEIMAGLNEVMFRVGAHYASLATQAGYSMKPFLDPGIHIENNVSGSVISPVSVFKTDLAYFAGAAFVQLFTIGAILITFWGWWNLGRDFSFSPLEIGKAFDAPLMSHIGCHERGRDIARDEGRRLVKYGVVKDEVIYVPDPGYTVEKVSIADQGRVVEPTGERLGIHGWLRIWRHKAPKLRRKGGASDVERA